MLGRLAKLQAAGDPVGSPCSKGLMQRRLAVR